MAPPCRSRMANLVLLAAEWDAGAVAGGYGVRCGTRRPSNYVRVVMVLSRTAVLLCVPAMALAAAVSVATPAIADCSGPHISFSPEVAGPGEAIVVTGEAFGDACHDTGVPPGASGVLGEPREGLAIVVM